MIWLFQKGVTPQLSVDPLPLLPLVHSPNAFRVVPALATSHTRLLCAFCELPVSHPRYISHPKLCFDHSDGALRLDRKYYDLWDYATSKAALADSLPDRRLYLTNTTSSPPPPSR